MTTSHLNHRHPYPSLIQQTHQKWANAHEAPILDLSWRDDSSFATGSADKTIKLFDLAQPEPIQTFRVRLSCGDDDGRGGCVDGSVVLPTESVDNLPNM